MSQSGHTRFVLERMLECAADAVGQKAGGIAAPEAVQVCTLYGCPFQPGCPKHFSAPEPSATVPADNAA